MQKMYFLIVLGVLLTVVEFGILAPYLVSAPSTEAVLLGIVSLVLYFPAMAKIVNKVRAIINSINSKMKEDQNEEAQ